MGDTKSTPNTGTEWIDEDIEQLRELAKGNTPTGVIGVKLGWTEDAIAAKASELNISLAPANRPPYGTTTTPLPDRLKIPDKVPSILWVRPGS